MQPNNATLNIHANRPKLFTAKCFVEAKNMTQTDLICIKGSRMEIVAYKNK